MVMNWILDIFKKCLENLDSLACEYGIHDVKWKIYNKDYLKEMNNKNLDFIIGNPPYISYADLDLVNESIYKR